MLVKSNRLRGLQPAVTHTHTNNSIYSRTDKGAILHNKVAFSYKIAPLLMSSSQTECERKIMYHVTHVSCFFLV